MVSTVSTPSALERFVLGPLLVLLPAAVSGLLVWGVVLPGKYHRALDLHLHPVVSPTARALESLFAHHDYYWPPTENVPSIAVSVLPRDLADLDVKRRKALFFRALLPIVLAENERIARQRAFIRAQFNEGVVDPASASGRRLERIAAQYRVKGDLNDEDVREKLLLRVDAVPLGLVLAQAANESGWGTSRFAVEGNNLFGQWTFRQGAGLVPVDRPEGATHMVRAFRDLPSSVRAYLHNINVGRAYRGLRAVRAALRARGRALDPLELAAGLVSYSERGEAYVEEIRDLIRINDLDRLGPLHLEG